MIKSNESTILFLGGTVQKLYKKKNTSEADFLERYKSPYFVELIARYSDRIEMKNVGVPMGKNERNEEGDYEWDWEYVKMVGTQKLKSWLSGLKEELERLGVSHGDICPPNICYNTQTKELKLIDFTFSKKGEYPREEKESWQAPYNDEKYISKLTEQLEQHESH